MSYYPQLAKTFSELLDSLGGSKVLVLGHARPDGDCIGSQIALVRLLRKQGLEAVALNADPIPQALSFLDGDVSVGKLNAESAKNGSIVFVDCADENRVGNAASLLLSGRSFTGNIDHHISNTKYAKHNLVESGSAATCEIIAGLAFDLGWEIDATTAQALLTGIMTDTGRFGYPATSSRVFELSSRLVDYGARPHITAQALYENEPFSRLKLLQRFLGTLRTEFDGQLGYGRLLQSDFEETGSSYEETEGFVDYTRAIRGARIGLYLEERKSMVKASLRAEDATCRVDQIAKLFGGGGHACAAAFSSDESIDSIEVKIMAAIGDRLAEMEATKTQHIN